MSESPPGRPSEGRPPAPDDQPTQRLDGTELWPGRILGDRYRVERLLGRGGMGEVWQAFDLKLCVEVALKALRLPQGDAGHLELLRNEVRAARGVLSPNVCRIFDLIEADGQELLSMEYVDGSNLSEYLGQNGSPNLQRAIEIASQLLAGLQAIHDGGLIHRDLKPENVMITRAGRVVVMDFGIAKAVAEKGHGTIVGTPAYMAPEQMRGDRVDARTDVYAAGMVLAELIYRDTLAAPSGLDGLRRGIRHDPPQLPDGPWHDALVRALAVDPEKRWPSARAFARALEDVTLRVGGMEDKNPFPGLSSFTEANAEFFFGREADVEALGKKLKRLHMLAVVGPSGVGKSSFLRAGLIPSLPKGWACVICAPGPSPFVSLGQALAPQLTGDTEAMRAFLRFGEVDVAVSMFQRWRQRHEEALLVVDQFEELFTQNPKEVQERFAELLGRLPIEARVRVLLSMRDDFLFRCHALPGLRPILTELTLLTPLLGADLRRAIVQPALACGFRFEEGALVDHMAAEVESERGALPLLAFTAARLWEHRDGKRGVIPSEAYEKIGGVAGSLAQHAEATLERVGHDRQALVREIFRNLTTSQGTRVSRERDELLSVFKDRNAAEEVLSHLIDARLLTSYETADPNDPSVRRQRVEIVHESLLSHWPRLVRWQTQDADGAQLRDQLRQAAQLWQEHGRSEDLLWTGSVYQEFSLWRERYPGGLTTTEEAFAAAMTARARQAQRRRRTVLASAFAAIFLVLGIVGMLWQSSERAQRKAVEEARRAESAKLYLLAKGEWNPPTALAYAMAALELSDQPEYRHLALHTMLHSPMPLRLPPFPQDLNRTPYLDKPWRVQFSPDGQWLAVGWAFSGGVQLYRLDGREPRILQGHQLWVTETKFSDDSKLLMTVSCDSTIGLWSIPEGKLIRTLRFPEMPSAWLCSARDRLTVATFVGAGSIQWESHPLAEGEGRILGRTPTTASNQFQIPNMDVDPTGSYVAYPMGRELLLYQLERLDQGPVCILGRHPAPITGARFSPDGRMVVSHDEKGDVRLWSMAVRDGSPVRVLRAGEKTIHAAFDGSGSWLAVTGIGLRLFDLRSPGRAPLVLNDGEWTFDAAFHPRGQWLATAAEHSADAWPISDAYPMAFGDTTLYSLKFAPDGKWLVTGSRKGSIQIWPLDQDRIGSPRPLNDESTCFIWCPETDDLGRYVFASTDQNSLTGAHALMISVETGRMKTFPELVGAFWVDAGGQWLAEAGDFRTNRFPRLWNTTTGKSREIGALDESPVGFDSDGRLILSGSSGNVVATDLQNGTRRTLFEGLRGAPVAVPGRKELLVSDPDSGLILYPIDGSSGSRRLRGTVPPGVIPTANATADLIVAAYRTGEIDILDTPSGRMHRLPVADGSLWCDIDPQRRWIATTRPGEGASLWPIPTGRLTMDLPRTDLLDELRSVTNISAVKDTSSVTGYKLVGRGLPDWNHPPR
jgi:WD40 repeat protein